MKKNKKFKGQIVTGKYIVELEKDIKKLKKIIEKVTQEKDISLDYIFTIEWKLKKIKEILNE